MINVFNFYVIQLCFLKLRAVVIVGSNLIVLIRIVIIFPFRVVD
jgi:hypothetical protein